MANNTNNSGKILIGFLAGAAVGAIVGILLAPDKGEITRQNLADASSKLKEDLNNQIQKGLDKFNSLKETAFGKAFGEEGGKNGKKSPVGEEKNSGNF
jgi:gas vesicle protein